MPLIKKLEDPEPNAFGWVLPNEPHPLPRGLEARTLIKIIDRYQPGAHDNDFRYKVRDRAGNVWDIHCSNLKSRTLYTWELDGEWYHEHHPRVQHYLERELKHAEAALEEKKQRVDDLRWCLERSKEFMTRGRA